MSIVLMTNEGIHIINKQVFELKCPMEAHAFGLRHKISYDVQYRIEKIMEQACNHLVEGNEDIRIPLLAIDLGMLSFDRLETELLAAFEKKFAEQLATYIPAQLNSKDVAAGNRSSLEILQHFILTGKLPWFAGKQQEYYLADLFDELFSSNSDGLKQIILVNLNNDHFIERLVEQPGIVHLNKIIQLLELDEELVEQVEALIKTILEQFIIQLTPGVGDTNQPAQQDQLIVKKSEDSNDAAKRFIQYLQGNSNLYIVYLRKAALEIILKTVVIKNNVSIEEQLAVQLEKILTAKFDVPVIGLSYIYTIGKAETKDLPERIDVIKVKLEEMKKLVEQREEKIQISESQKFYISNAGLILLANYLPALFTELQLMKDGNFISTHQQVKAVFLLHYLCTGKEEVPEYILPLNKILCGLSLDEPLPSFYPLTEKDKTECEELLQEVINNWQRLGNATVEGLREAFLNREGILSFENNGWKLIIERMGHDVLLDAIPWSFRHSKLSWMQHLITTEW